MVYAVHNSVLRYWDGRHRPIGFAVFPGSGTRFYDDNVWIVINFLELAELTGGRIWQEWGKHTYDYVMSGWDDRLGGRYLLERREA